MMFFVPQFALILPLLDITNSLPMGDMKDDKMSTKVITPDLI